MPTSAAKLAGMGDASTTSNGAGIDDKGAGMSGVDQGQERPSHGAGPASTDVRDGALPGPADGTVPGEQLPPPAERDGAPGAVDIEPRVNGSNDTQGAKSVASDGRRAASKSKSKKAPPKRKTAWVDPPDLGELQRRFGRHVGRYRRSLGISQEKFSYLLHCHPKYVGFIEQGRRNLSLKTIERIADSLKLDIYDLLADDADLVVVEQAQAAARKAARVEAKRIAEEKRAARLARLAAEGKEPPKKRRYGPRLPDLSVSPEAIAEAARQRAEEAKAKAAGGSDADERRDVAQEPGVGPASTNG